MRITRELNKIPCACALLGLPLASLNTGWVSNLLQCPMSSFGFVENWRTTSKGSEETQQEKDPQKGYLAWTLFVLATVPEFGVVDLVWSRVYTPWNSHLIGRHGLDH